MEPVRKNNRAVLGVLLIIIGVILVGVNLDWIPFSIQNWILTWQMLLIAIGLVLVASKENKGPGLVLIFIGLFFLAVKHFDEYYYLHRLFWPSLIIFIGLLFLFRGRRPGHWREKSEISDSDMLDEIALFGGGNKLVTSKNFKGGRITAIFGGSTIDFSQAQLANGINLIDIVSIFGGAKLIVPRDWDIVLEVTAVFGGFSDKRIVDPHIVHDPTKKLVIKGIAVFGGGEINYL